jgi:WhiB family redox-sensing transcriptional regulator
VWGGQLIEDGVIIERKRRAGRPPRQVIAAVRMDERMDERVQA